MPDRLTQSDFLHTNFHMEIHAINSRDVSNRCNPGNDEFFAMADRFCIPCRKPVHLNYCINCGQKMRSRNVNYGGMDK